MSGPEIRVQARGWVACPPGPRTDALRQLRLPAVPHPGAPAELGAGERVLAAGAGPDRGELLLLHGGPAHGPDPAALVLRFAAVPVDGARLRVLAPDRGAAAEAGGR